MEIKVDVRLLQFCLLSMREKSTVKSWKKTQLNLHFLATAIRARFQTEKETRALHLDWDRLALLSRNRDNQSKTLTNCLQMLISRFSNIQSSFPEQYHNRVVMRDKLMDTIYNLNVWHLQYQKSFATLKGVDLQASVLSVSTSTTTLEPAAHYVERQHRSASFNDCTR